MPGWVTRRALIGGALASAATLAGGWRGLAQEDEPGWTYPIGWPGQTLGDGFVIRHGFACENTWYSPGWFHCAEDWYVEGRETGGAGVYAVGDGEVVYVGFDYPGRVVIVRHRDELYSMYGHLEYDVPVQEGQRVARGELVGVVHYRTDGRTPSHLHFEVRNFLINRIVNGGDPRHGVRCGFNCQPGPGYWPIAAPEHPVDLGWRNPLHSIHRHAVAPVADEVIVATFGGGSRPLWTEPADHPNAELVDTLRLAPGDRLRWLATATRDPARRVTSAEGYRLWYRVETERGEKGWIEAAIASTRETGSDGRPSMVEMILLPAIEGR